MNVRCLSTCELMVSNMAEIGVEELELEHVFDSGCTDHMINNREELINIQKTNIRVGVAKKGVEIIANHMGQLKATTSLGCQVTFEKVLYIPTLRRNLISMTRLLLGGYRIEAEGREVQIFRSGMLLSLIHISEPTRPY